VQPVALEQGREGVEFSERDRSSAFTEAAVGGEESPPVGSSLSMPRTGEFSQISTRRPRRRPHSEFCGLSFAGIARGLQWRA
jgi:hypothetical protein